jgi:hypothetical protein
MGRLGVLGGTIVGLLASCTLLFSAYAQQATPPQPGVPSSDRP